MTKLSLSILATIFLISCSDDGGNIPAPADVFDDIPTAPITDINDNSVATLANSFCAGRRMMNEVSTSLYTGLSHLTNSPINNSCGGDISLSEDSSGFAINMQNYCDATSGKNLTMNGSIIGTTISGANFSSTVTDFGITGSNTNLLISGTTDAGRLDDVFLHLILQDQLSGKTIGLDNVSFKQGRFDFGFLVLDVGRFEFKLIKPFNVELTEGLLFFYGPNGEEIIVSGDSGDITVVYKQDPNDQTDTGTWIETTCND